MKSSVRFISIIAYFMLLVTSNGNGQSNKRFMDSINSTLAKYNTDTERINKVNEICMELVWRSSAKLDMIDTLANNALLIAKKMKFKKGIADAYNVLGAKEWFSDDYTASIEDYTRAEKIEEEINYKAGIATSIDGIGEINSDNQNYADALIDFNKALRIYSDIKDTDDIESVFEDMSDCYINKNSYDSAFLFGMKAFKLSEKRNDKWTMVNALNDIGRYYALKNDYGNSMRIFAQMRPIINNLKDNDNQLIGFYQGIANALLNLKKYNDALINMDSAMNIARKLSSIDDIMKSENIISTIYEKMGDNNLALKHYKIYDSIHSQIFSQNNTRRVTRSELNFQFEKQEAIDKIKQEKTEAIEGIVAGVFIFLAIGLSFYIIKINKKNKTIEEKNRTIEEKDIQLLIAGGENDKVEFKSSLSFDLGRFNADGKVTSSEKVQFSCIKTIPAFLNSEGGHLIIGIEDDRNILGLERTDFLTFSKSAKKKHFDPCDDWKLLLDELIGDKIGNSAHALIQTRLISIENKMIAVITVESSSAPIWMKSDKGAEELYIRRTASTIALQGHEAMQYIKLHWKK